MTISCATLEAATKALAVLIDARLWPGHQVEASIPQPLSTPISYTILIHLPNDMLRRLGGIPDTTLR
jgi:hypothetical protein